MVLCVCGILSGTLDKNQLKEVIHSDLSYFKREHNLPENVQVSDEICGFLLTCCFCPETFVGIYISLFPGSMLYHGQHPQSLRK